MGPSKVSFASCNTVRFYFKEPSSGKREFGISLLLMISDKMLCAKFQSRPGTIIVLQNRRKFPKFRRKVRSVSNYKQLMGGFKGETVSMIADSNAKVGYYNTLLGHVIVY